MWFDLLKQPKLVGDIGIIDLSNVPKEPDDKCRKKLVEIYEFWKDYENLGHSGHFHQRIKKKFVIKLEDLNSVPEEICCEFLGELARFLDSDHESASTGVTQKRIKGYWIDLNSEFWNNKSELFLGLFDQEHNIIWLIKIWSTAVSDDDIPLLKTLMEDMLIYLKKQTKGF